MKSTFLGLSKIACTLSLYTASNNNKVDFCQTLYSTSDKTNNQLREQKLPHFLNLSVVFAAQTTLKMSEESYSMSPP